jgi:hypothetical protein
MSMQTEDLIILDEFCASHQLEVSFVHSLNEYGLVEVVTIEQTEYIPNNELLRLEKMVRLYQDLNINPEGIDAVENLLNRIELMQQEITRLQNKLRFYENED